MANKDMQPRMRVNRNAALTLSTTWQKIDFNGTDEFNINSFGKDPISGNPMVWWDPTNKLFKFYEQNDQNYLVFLFLATTATLITTRATIQYRFVVPNGRGSGTPLYFPFPNEGGYVDAAEITILQGVAQNHKAEPVALYLTDSLRNNGFWIEVKLSNALITLGVATLNSATLLVQSTK